MAPRTERVFWYDFPELYDIVFQEGTSKEVTFLENVWKAHGSPVTPRILEPASGSGRLLLEFARRGYDVSGFDGNPRMVDYALRKFRQVGLEANLRRGLLENFRYRKKFDLAFCLINTFRYLLAEESARSHLRCVAKSLRPGGLYAIGIHLCDYRDRSKSRERQVGTRGGTTVVYNLQSWPPDPRRRTEKYRSRLKVIDQGQPRFLESEWLFRTYGPRQMGGLIASVPELQLVATYDFDYDVHKPSRAVRKRLDQVYVLKK